MLSISPQRRDARQAIKVRRCILIFVPYTIILPYSIYRHPDLYHTCYDLAGLSIAAVAPCTTTGQLPLLKEELSQMLVSISLDIYFHFFYTFHTHLLKIDKPSRAISTAIR